MVDFGNSTRPLISFNPISLVQAFPSLRSGDEALLRDLAIAVATSTDSSERYDSLVGLRTLGLNNSSSVHSRNGSVYIDLDLGTFYGVVKVCELPLKKS